MNQPSKIMKISHKMVVAEWEGAVDEMLGVYIECEGNVEKSRRRYKRKHKDMSEFQVEEIIEAAKPKYARLLGAVVSPIPMLPIDVSMLVVEYVFQRPPPSQPPSPPQHCMDTRSRIFDLNSFDVFAMREKILAGAECKGDVDEMLGVYIECKGDVKRSRLRYKRRHNDMSVVQIDEVVKEAERKYARVMGAVILPIPMLSMDVGRLVLEYVLTVHRDKTANEIRREYGALSSGDSPGQEAEPMEGRRTFARPSRR